MTSLNLIVGHLNSLDTTKRIWNRFRNKLLGILKKIYKILKLQH